eukprot:m.40321 g.40321  ORF g.40321 m.40321 type:complete len:65 (+) comp6918_c2_seq1:320-514(+)
MYLFVFMIIVIIIIIMFFMFFIKKFFFWGGLLLFSYCSFITVIHLIFVDEQISSPSSALPSPNY